MLHSNYIQILLVLCKTPSAINILLSQKKAIEITSNYSYR